jgi:hypothetical protein
MKCTVTEKITLQIFVTETSVMVFRGKNVTDVTETFSSKYCHVTN